MNNAGVHETQRGPYIGTFTGSKFYPRDVRPHDIDIRDIAHALSLQCRFAGHSKWHYSVGQHSILVSYELERMGFSNLSLDGLLHDASEAYLVDVPRPIKHIVDFSAYREIEKNTQEVIFRKYLGYPNERLPVVTADNLLLAKEAYILMNNPFWCRSMPKSKQAIKRMDPRDVEKAFLKRFYKLYLYGDE